MAVRLPLLAKAAKDGTLVHDGVWEIKISAPSRALLCKTNQTFSISGGKKPL